MTPYTYLIGWSKQDVWYYGCQYGKNRANPKNLWKTYFTSSDYVAMMRLWHGEPDVVEVRKVFRTKKQALRCEEKVLDKVNAVKSPRWLNRGNAGKDFYMEPGYHQSTEHITNRIGKITGVCSEAKRKSNVSRVEKMIKLNTGKKRPEHAAFMRVYRQQQLQKAGYYGK